MSKVTNYIEETGGSFLVSQALEQIEILTPELFTDEQKMIAKTTEEFVEREITALGEKANQLDYQLSKDLVKKAGEVGLLGVCLPEEYGGLGLDGVRFALIKEHINLGPSSMTATVGGQMGIGMLPIIFFGTPEQREKYLPALEAGTITTAFALTEPSSGTDASSIKTTAHLSEDGKYYILNGGKVFITNAGFADIFVVFAKINGTDFSAFIVERDSEGLSIGPEEKKMGLKASSTCSITFDNVKVPAENLLGKQGQGHRFAFNTLNFGRLSVGAGCLGNSKHALDCSAKYANQRIQFGKPISSFPLIGKKLADINTRIFVLESMIYRTAGVFDKKLKEIDFKDPDLENSSRKAIGEFMLECSINKVFGSETLDFAADEGLQIHGGYGYIQEYDIEGIYRDARIKRIFEGTNEMNRLFITKTLIKRLEKGRFPLLQQALDNSEAELRNLSPESSDNDVLETEKNVLLRAKKIYHFTLAKALQKYGAALEDEQELSSDLADIAIQIYAIESAWLRAKKILEVKGAQKAENAIHMAVSFIHEAFERVIGYSQNILCAVLEEAELNQALSLIHECTKIQKVNQITLKRAIAAKVIDAEKYVI